MGRPFKEIDKKLFENLCGIQCTLEEIAGCLDVSEDTVERWCIRTYDKPFNEVYKEKRNKGFASLRRMQFKLAERNAAMAIFLGKNYLNQTDRVEQKIVTDIQEISEKVGDILDEQ